jgi:transposase-like protein
MTKVQGKSGLTDLKEHLSSDGDFLRGAVRAALEAALEAEMTEA